MTLRRAACRSSAAGSRTHRVGPPIRGRTLRSGPIREAANVIHAASASTPLCDARYPRSLCHGSDGVEPIAPRRRISRSEWVIVRGLPSRLGVAQEKRYFVAPLPATLPVGLHEVVHCTVSLVDRESFSHLQILGTTCWQGGQFVCWISVRHGLFLIRIVRAAFSWSPPRKAS
jgi:hypothetical protein